MYASYVFHSVNILHSLYYNGETFPEFWNFYFTIESITSAEPNRAHFL